MIIDYNQYIQSLNESAAVLTKADIDIFDNANAELKMILTKYNGMKNVPKDILDDLRIQFKAIPDITAKIDSAKRKLSAEFTDKYETDIRINDTVFSVHKQKYGNSNKIQLIVIENDEDEAILKKMTDTDNITLTVNGKEIAENYKFTKSEIISAAKELYIRTKLYL